jgi:peptide deformylase
MKIVTVPHRSLRKVAQPFTAIDKKSLTFLRELGETLVKKENPRGVGLAAPQVDMAWRVFATYLPESGKREDADPILRLFINPKILDVSKKLTFGPNPEEPILEGCLSIPEIYGPVPRHEWVEVEFQEVTNTELIQRKERFEDFAARVVQHEYDHLDGRLFIDYSAELDLPLFKEQGKKMNEMNADMVKAFYQQSL